MPQGANEHLLTQCSDMRRGKLSVTVPSDVLICYPPQTHSAELFSSLNGPSVSQAVMRERSYSIDPISSLPAPASFLAYSVNGHVIAEIVCVNYCTHDDFENRNRGRQCGQDRPLVAATRLTAVNKVFQRCDVRCGWRVWIYSGSERHVLYERGSLPEWKVRTTGCPPCDERIHLEREMGTRGHPSAFHRLRMQLVGRGRKCVPMRKKFPTHLSLLFLPCRPSGAAHSTSYLASAGRLSLLLKKG